VPRWNVEKEKLDKNLMLPGLILLVFIVSLYVSIRDFVSDQTNYFLIFGIIASTIFITYIVGRIYGEINQENDFIEVSDKGISFRSTPGFGMGWLPVSKQLAYDEIQSVDMIEVSQFFSPNEKKKAILLWPKNEKQIILGSYLEGPQLMNVVIAMKGSVVLSQKLKNLFGRDTEASDTIRKVAEFGKQMWNRYKEAREEK
jgi:hypothetical protein